MAKEDKEKVAAPSEPMPQTGCVICGSYAQSDATGKFVDVTAHARAHEKCGAARPDVIAKVKARA